MVVSDRKYERCFLSNSYTLLGMEKAKESRVRQKQKYITLHLLLDSTSASLEISSSTTGAQPS